MQALAYAPTDAVAEARQAVARAEAAHAAALRAGDMDAALQLYDELAAAQAAEARVTVAAMRDRWLGLADQAEATGDVRWAARMRAEVAQVDQALAAGDHIACILAVTGAAARMSAR